MSYKQNHEYNEDIYIAAKQVSEYLIGSTYIECNGGYYYKSIDEQELCIVYDNRRLVKKKGYEIILKDINDAYFEVKDNYVYLNIERDNKDYTFLVHIIHGEDDE